MTEQQATIVLTSPVPEIVEEIADRIVILLGEARCRCRWDQFIWFRRTSPSWECWSG
ncbi:MAG: hypothetical protein ACKV2Q_08545 [Planctomycetaceae bacterium]